MQEVLRDRPNKVPTDEDDKKFAMEVGGKCWDESQTWGFIQKHICKRDPENSLLEKLVKEDQRQRLMNRIMKMQDYQQLLAKQQERQRRLEE